MSWENLLFAYAETKAKISGTFINSTISLLPKPLASFCGCIALFLSDLVGNPEDRLFHDKAKI